MKLEDIPPPIGQLIIDSGLGEMTQDGLYLHYTDVITMMRTYAEPQLKEKDIVISEYHTKMMADKESYFEVVEAHEELESQLKEAKQLLGNAHPIWKENCAKWTHWYNRLKELVK